MKKLMKAYKNLPKEMKIVIAMAGLGTPFGAFYALRRILNVSPMMLIVYIAVAVAAIALIGFVITKLFSRGSKKRAQKMADELSSDSSAGPMSMDVRAAAKGNTDKFFAAIRDMKKNYGVDVYDLPWYIVIGDSGCGKTKLINEGGLQFSTGKPEGYQLGTLNYNWWFTEDAIFIDMAGRLCNPRDDADFREWESFLDTVKKGRKGFPINGAVVCVSADHLLQDAPEKIEADANTTLERLRDLQSKLGVTFATYLVITKCDKILGFMELFDRAERDITVKNQIVGWSKPGEFNQLYDPEQFELDFDQLYGRLHELRMRRLMDDEDEDRLGLAYSFAEEFRGLLEPLKIYVRTLFPMIKNPRAIKNLLFRGVYFTSATQEGALILKHLTERLGEQAAEQFAPLDMYPNKRPFFIRDVLIEKVIPEHGLVFRNEGEAVRSKKLGKLLMIGTAVTTVLLIGAFIWSAGQVGELIVDPTAHATDARANVTDAKAAMKTVSMLADDVNALEKRKMPVIVLSAGVGASEPIRDLTRIQLGLFEEGVLKRTVGEVEDVLLGGDIKGTAPNSTGVEPDAYLASLVAYIRWYGCRAADRAPEPVNMESFTALHGVLTSPESATAQASFDDLTRKYFTRIRDDEGFARNPAKWLAHSEDRSAETIREGLKHARNKILIRNATLSDAHADATIREWMRIQSACALAGEQYKKMLAEAEAPPETLEGLEDFRNAFSKEYAGFDGALASCEWRGPRGEAAFVTIKPLADAIIAQRQAWLDYQQSLKEAYLGCEVEPDPVIVHAIDAISKGDPARGVPGLDQVLWRSLTDAKLTEAEFYPGFYDDYQRHIKEVYSAYDHMIVLEPGGGTTNDRVALTADAKNIREMVTGLYNEMSALDPAKTAKLKSPREWNDRMVQVMDTLDALSDDKESGDAMAGLHPFWESEKLAVLNGVHREMVQRGDGTAVLRAIESGVGEVGEWGFAELVDDWCKSSPSQFLLDPLPQCGESVAREREDDEPKEEESRRSRRRGRRSRRDRTERRADRTRESSRKDQSARSGATAIEGRGYLPQSATRDFFVSRVDEWDELQFNLTEFSDAYYFDEADSDVALNERCLDLVDGATEDYLKSYIRTWSDVYRGKEIRSLAKLGDEAEDWFSLVETLEGGRRGADRQEIGNEIASSLRELLAAVPFWHWYYEKPLDRWQPSNFEEPYWADFRSWLDGAIRSEWDRDTNRFVSNTLTLPEGDRSEAPWDLLANDFLRVWNELTQALVDNRNLPDDFGRDARDARLTPIPWGQLQRLRQQFGLGDERLTDEMVQFEVRAQELLSQELTNILADLQSDLFPRSKSSVGWPYVDGDDLATVDFEDFKTFLSTIRFARETFKPLESEMNPDEKYYSERRQFYDDCDRWWAFVGLSDDTLSSTPLGVEISGGDPLTAPNVGDRPDDTAQQYYRYVDLDLGLRLVGEDASRGAVGAIRVATLREEKVLIKKAVWDWATDTGRRRIQVRFTEGWDVEAGSRERYPDIPKVLGDVSPLSFCAYLYREGQRQGDQWLTVHKADFRTEWKAQGKGHLVQRLETDKYVRGEMFVFKLERSMPDPIMPIQRATDRGGRRRR